MELTSIISVLVGTVAFAVQTHGVIWEADMPRLLKQCYEEYSLTSLDSGNDIHTYCLGKYIWQIPNVHGRFNITENEINHIKSAYREFQQKLHSARRHKRQAQRALRRELRVLSDEERRRFFNALNILKQNNFYDAWAKVHSVSRVISSAHGGPNFLGFHRVYLLFLEFQLQKAAADSSISLCYWDSSMDYDMEHPQETAMFTSQLVGNGNGPVINGPFADWSADGRPLDRNINFYSSSLMTKRDINRFFEGNEALRHRDMVTGFGNDGRHTIEGQHGNVHNWVGGTMMDAVTAAYDPVFILHHTFIDYIWERFRQKIRQQGIDPSTDYPFVDPRTGNGSMAALIDPRTGTLKECENVNQRSRESLPWSLSGIQRVSDGIDQTHLNRGPALAGIRNSARTRTASVQNVEGFRNLNIPYNPVRHLWDQRLRFNAYQRSNPARSYLPRNFPLIAKKFPRMVHHQNLAIPNTFKMGGEFNKHPWVYLPVHIIYKRPKPYIGSRTVYDFPFAINKGKYYPQIYPFSNVLPNKALATFHGCLKNMGGFSKVFVQSNGVSYPGQYLDYAVFDNRKPVSKSIVYVAVKSPNLGVVQSYITAFDSCGRVCIPRCLIPGSIPPAYRPCSGVVNISNRLPLMYGRTYGEAVRRRRSFAVKRCPKCFHGEIFITFHCGPNKFSPLKGSGGGRIRRKFK